MKKRFTDEQIIGVLREAEVGATSQFPGPLPAPVPEFVLGGIPAVPLSELSSRLSASQLAGSSPCHTS